MAVAEQASPNRGETTARTFWDAWLLVAIAGVAGFSAGFVVAGDSMITVFDRLLFGSAESPVRGAAALDYLKFSFGVLGAVTIGWMVALLPIALGPLRRRERFAWSSIAWSVGVWFVIDSTFSVLSGFPENAVLNVGFVALFAIPLLAMRRELADD